MITHFLTLHLRVSHTVLRFDKHWMIIDYYPSVLTGVCGVGSRETETRECDCRVERHQYSLSQSDNADSLHITKNIIAPEQV